MSTSKPKFIAALALGAAALLALTGCGSNSAEAPAVEETTTGAPAPEVTETEEAAESYYPITVTDLAGNEVTIESADAVGVTDNRFFQLVADWDLPVVVAPLDLFSVNNPLKESTTILNTGTHREPDLEKFIDADPDIIINGYRYGGDTGVAVAQAAPDAAFIDMTAPDTVTADEYVVSSLTLMGEIFNKQNEAAQLISEFHAAIDEAKAAYDPAVTVMGLVTTGNDINYSNPTDGRGASIFFDLLSLTPALDTAGSSDHTGDDISLEAIAQANADSFLVLDRAAAVSGDGEENQPALELITGSASLANVPAVQNNAIYVMPADYYLTEDVFAYIKVLNGLTELFNGLK